MTFTWQQGKITIESKRLFAQQEVTRDRFGDNQDAAVSFTKLDFTRVLFQAGKDLRKIDLAVDVTGPGKRF